MKTYTVNACTKNIDTKSTLQHDGEKWREGMFDQTTFESREEAEQFAIAEKEAFEIDVEMKIVECDDEE